MKIGARVLIIACLLAFSAFIQISFAKVDFIFERLTVKYINKNYGKLSASVFRFNRSMMAMNLSLTLFKTSTNDMRFGIEIRKFDGGVYKRTAFQLDQELCHFLNGQYKIIFGSYLKDGYMKEFVQECPVPPHAECKPTLCRKLLARSTLNVKSYNYVENFVSSRASYVHILQGVYEVHNAGIPPMPPNLPAWRILFITKIYKPSEPLLEVHSYINFKDRIVKKN